MAGRALAVLSTAGSQEVAATIATRLVEERLAACANIIGPIRSIYRWRGKVENDREWLLVIKTTASRLLELTKRLQELHPYEVPEVLALAAGGGSPSYLKWLAEAVAKPRRLPASSRGDRAGGDSSAKAPGAKPIRPRSRGRRRSG